MTDFNRRIFVFLRDRLQQGYPFSLSLFSESFSPEEMGKITGIEAMHAELDISPKAVSDCIRILKEKKLNTAQAAELDDQDFAALFNQMRQKK